MSVIKSMTIKGIRSFGVEDDEEQEIQFGHPLTLIVGRNGAGKTTIIECLKYVATGDQPGNSKGGAFVHDPKLLGKSQVTAEVGLVFSSIEDEEHNVKRVLNAKLQNGGKVSLTTRDSFITNANMSQVSTRKVFTNQEMVSLLGVSKAILENVIFCHQEDSNWPLSEGKTLKEKFDKIFDATRYNKSLERIKKVKKSKEDTNKIDAEKLVRLEENSKLAQERGASLQDMQAKLDAETVQVKEITKKLKEVEKKALENEKLLRRIDDMKLEVRDTKTSLKDKTALRDDLKQTIKEIFKGTRTELAKMKSKQEKEHRKTMKQLQNDEKKIREVREGISDLSEKETSLAAEQGELEQEFKSVQKKKGERSAMMKQFSQKFELGIEIGKDVTDSLVQDFKTKAREQLQSKQHALKKLKEKATISNEEYHQRLVVVVGQKAKLENTIEHWQQASSDKQDKMQQMKSILAEQAEHTTMKELQQKEEQMKKADELKCMDTMRQEIANLMVKKQQCRGSLEKMVQEGLRRHQGNTRDKLQETITLRALRAIELEEKKGISWRISAKLDGLHLDQFENELEKLEQNLRELQNQKGFQEGMKSAQEQLLKSLQAAMYSDRTPCPLCRQHFSCAQDAESLLQVLEKRLLDPDEKIQSLNEDLQEAWNAYRNLQMKRPLVEEMRKLQTKDIPNLKQALAELDSEIDMLRVDVGKEEVPDESRMDVKKAGQVNLETSWYSRETHDTSPAELNLLDVLNVMLDCDRTLDQKQSELENHQTNVLALKEHVLKLQSEQLMQSKQQHDFLKNEEQLLKTEIRQLTKRIQKNERDAAALKDEHEDIENSKNDTAGKHENQLKILSEDEANMETTLKEIEKLDDEIGEYVRSGRSDLRQATVKRTEAALQERKARERQAANLQKAIDSARDMTLKSQEDGLNDLEDNLELFRRNEEIEECQKRIATLKEDILKLNPTKAIRLDDDLTRERNSLNDKNVEAVTNQNHFSNAVKQLKSELGQDKLKNAEEDYKDCMFRVTATKIAISDLDKYCKAMHSAILRYHEIKMAEINRKIRDIWQKMYRGHDIEYIEIVSEIGKSESETTSSRMKYNYRVVKCHQGRKIDMRGRCSAGQKVIASLVIRLALAETFCINCGILALDEPTTNLDHHHIKSLAKSLISITREKESQQNFQLLVITHNEEFAERLGREGYINHFYRIEKIEGKSQIIYSPIGAVSSSDADGDEV